MTPQEELDALHAEQKKIETRIAAIYAASVLAPTEEKLCADWMASSLSEPVATIQYPITVHGITYSKDELVDYRRSHVGKYVAVRPVDKSLEGKTFLGIYLGDIAVSMLVRFHAKSGVLEAGHAMHNPAIWVPDIKRIVFGRESWWGAIKSPADLKQITDADIQNVWYVQALREAGDAAVPVARCSECGCADPNGLMHFADCSKR
jgi:hypothetical protein